MAPAGLAIELGVFNGHSLAAIRGVRKPPVVGFDCWTGLPSAWDRGDGASDHPVGRFATSRPTDVANGVTLVDGLFADSLPPWLASHEDPIQFMHVDCDLYESAATALALVGPRLAPGAVIVFDELVDWAQQSYPNWPQGEWRALVEWIRASGVALRPIAHSSHEQAAFVKV